MLESLIINKFFNLATATLEVQSDIIRSLKLSNPMVTITSFDRKNLYIRVLKKTGGKLEDLLELDAFRGSEQNSAKIVYCQTRKSTESVQAFLNSNNIPCDYYHAGMSPC